MKLGLQIPADYTSLRGTRHAGHPLIEALPPLRESKGDYLTLYERKPRMPGPRVRKLSEMQRMMELETLDDILVAFPEHEEAGAALDIMLRSSYFARNRLEISDRHVDFCWPPIRAAS